MARIPIVRPERAGLVARIAYFMCKRRLGRVIEPIGIHAHHPRLLRALAAMEMGQEAAKSVEPRLKALAGLRTAVLIGCPF